MSTPDEPLSWRYRKVVSVSIGLYRKLLLAYPQEFREEYASEMACYFGEMCEDALLRGGLVALMAMWFRTLYELAVSARLEREMAVPQRDTEPGMSVLAALSYCPGAGQAYNGQWIKSALHALAFLAIFLMPFVWVPTFGAYVYVLLLAAVFAYSTLDAWLTARRIKAIQRADF